MSNSASASAPGIGIDLIDVERIRSAAERHGERFLQRIYTSTEREYCERMRNPYPHLAARFAAKEAVSKAFGTGIGADFSWTSAEVIHGPRGEPQIRLDAQGEALLRAIGGKSVKVSLTHTATAAAAVALIER